MADTEDSTAALPREVEEQEREEGDVHPIYPVPKLSDQLHEHGVEGDEEVEGVGAESKKQEVEEQLVVLEEDGDGEQDEPLGPRDEIKVTVTGYQRTADNCTFDVEVTALHVVCAIVREREQLGVCTCSVTHVACSLASQPAPSRTRKKVWYTLKGLAGETTCM